MITTTWTIGAAASGMPKHATFLVGQPQRFNASAVVRDDATQDYPRGYLRSQGPPA